MTKRRIAVLMHARHSPAYVQGYLVGHLAEIWRADGHEVVFLFGPDVFEPADVCLVHVDLSVVPEDYLALARRYPAALNGRARDLRKSVYSRGLLGPDDAWSGQVIVKSNLNYAGAPERNLLDKSDPSARRAAGFRHPTDYLLFDDLALVPERYFTDPLLVVQKFLPETQGGLYSVRFVSFLGSKVSGTRLLGPSPIVSGPTITRTEPCEPDLDILAEGRALGLDYAKLDYVVHDGEAILLDANKTVGVSANLMADPAMRAAREVRARGLYEFFT